MADEPAARLPPTVATESGSSEAHTSMDTALGSRPVHLPEPPAPIRALPEFPEFPDVSPWERYEDLGVIGKGGMGEVRRVRDRWLHRVLAMKVLLHKGASTDRFRARFLAEARLAAGLQHSGIVPAHDCGAMPDGRLWFTMPEVCGETLRSAVAAAHEAEPAGLSPAALRRLIDVFARVCEAVGYAHRHGVMHRDLKPDNVLIGALGEVYVVDWGLARPMDASADDPRDEPDEEDERLTLVGQVMGTPAYMPPEQARGDRDAMGPHSDVYALGAVLYEILCGRPPYEGSSATVLRLVRAGPPDPIVWRTRTRPADDLVTICERSMSRGPADRFPDAGCLAVEVRSFLDGVRRRDRAVKLLEDAGEIARKMQELRAQARALRAEASTILGTLQTWDPVEEKARGWTLEDEARGREIDAAVERVAWEARLQVALSESPDLPAAHRALAERYAVELAAAERARDVEAAARAEALLRLHDRGTFEALLNGHAAVSLVTEPSDAPVTLLRYVESSRRLVAEPTGVLGRTPLREVSLQHGSYLLCVRAEGYRETRYAVSVGRGETWDVIAPGETAPLAVPLLREAAHGPDDVYVPAGWFAAGGDPSAGESLPAQRVWVDGFLIERHPVTVEDYLSFLGDLVGRGRDAEADAACPRVDTAPAREDPPALFERDAEGRYQLDPGAPRERLRHPVTWVNWYGAAAYAAWYAERTGEPWRLPSELEHEKAARGVDGRFFPWGDQQEPTWACVVGSRPGESSLVPVDAYPTDESPYGVRGLAGNARDWCIDAWTPSGPPLASGRLVIVPATESDLRSIRGGAWTAAPNFAGRRRVMRRAPKHGPQRSPFGWLGPSGRPAQAPSRAQFWGM